MNNELFSYFLTSRISSFVNCRLSFFIHFDNQGKSSFALVIYKHSWCNQHDRTHFLLQIYANHVKLFSGSQWLFARVKL